MESEKQPDKSPDKAHDQADEEEISFGLPDLSRLGSRLSPKLKAFFSLKTLAFLLLILIPIIITIGVRVQPIELKMTDDWARNSVYSNLRNQIQSTIDQQYPTLPQANRDSMVEQQYQETIAENQAELDSQVTQASAYFKTAFQYQENGTTYTYLGDLDSYFYLRQARNLLEKGTICDQVINNSCIDDHMVAPYGESQEITLHPYAIVLTYRILHLFNKSINLMYASFYLPTLIAVLVSILAFLVARKIAGDVGGFFAAIFISTSQIFLTRTLGSDTDIWNLFFPILSLFLFISSIEAKKLIGKLSWAAVLGLSFGLYSFAWGAWWFTFDLVMLTYLLYLAYYLVQNLVEHKKDLKKILENKRLQHDILTFVTIILFSAISVSTFKPIGVFLGAPIQPFAMNSIDDASHTNIWPNVYTTVAELNNSSLAEAVGSVGGKLFFFLICLGITLAILKKEIRNRELTIFLVALVSAFIMIQDSMLGQNIIVYILLLAVPLAIAVFMVFKDPAIEIKYALLLLLWTAASLYAAMKGVRFVLLLTPVAGIAFGVAIGKLHSFFSSLTSRGTGINKIAVGLVLFLLFSTILIAPIKSAYSIGRNFLPSISSTWADSLTNIKANSAEDAIINSWWDFGHWFKYFADRRVTFDGASQNNPQAYWIGKTLLSEDEHVSVGILRMLDCGANKAYNTLYRELGNDSLKAIELVNKIIVLEKPEARSVLSAYLTDPERIDEVLSYTHCEPPEDYFITSDDMIGKAGVWAHFGSWDFTRSYIYNNLDGKTQQQAVELIKGLGYTSDEAQQMYTTIKSLQTQRDINNWIAPWPGYLSDSGTCSAAAGRIDCTFNIGVSQTDQYVVVIESSTFNLTDPGSSYITINYISRSDGANLGSERAAAASFVVTEQDGLKTYKPSAGLQPIGLDVLVDTQNMRGIISDPLLTKSLFTRLYYLDGRYTTHFQKLSDQKNNIVGHHVIVWKLDWQPN